MRRILAASLPLKILVTAVIIAGLGITPQMHAASDSMRLARMAYENGSPALAAAHLARAIDALPWRTDLWELAGQYAFEGKDLQHAAEYLTRAAGAGQLSAQGYLSLGDARQLAGDLTGALDAWNQALESGADQVSIYTRFLEIHAKLGDLPAEVADLKMLAQLQPNDAQVYYQLGLHLLALQPEAAQAYLLRAGELDPGLKSRADSLRRGIDTARLSAEPAFSLVESGRALASLDEWQLAGEAFHQATVIRPDYAEGWAYYGEALQHIAQKNLSGGDTPGAPVTLDQSGPVSPTGLQELQTALALDPASIPANTLMALYWQRQGRFDLALSFLEQAELLDPNNPAILSEIGNTVALSGDLEAALKSYQQATGIAPSNPLYWRLLAEFSITYNYQLRETGLPAARQAVLSAPDDPAALDTLAQVLILLDDNASAQRFLEKAIEKDPLYAAAHLHLGLIYQIEGKTTLAYQELTLAESLASPGSPVADKAQNLLQRYFNTP